MRVNLPMTKSFTGFVFVYRAVFLIFFCFACDQTPIGSGSKADNLKIEFFTVQKVSSNSAEILWSCSTKAEGFLFYGSGNGRENTSFRPKYSFYDQKISQILKI